MLLTNVFYANLNKLVVHNQISNKYILSQSKSLVTWAWLSGCMVFLGGRVSHKLIQVLVFKGGRQVEVEAPKISYHTQHFLKMIFLIRVRDGILHNDIFKHKLLYITCIIINQLGNSTQYPFGIGPYIMTGRERSDEQNQEGDAFCWLSLALTCLSKCLWKVVIFLSHFV